MKPVLYDILQKLTAPSSLTTYDCGKLENPNNETPAFSLCLPSTNLLPLTVPLPLLAAPRLTHSSGPEGGPAAGRRPSAL